MNAIATPSAEQAQQDIVEEFAFFGDWTERYQYLIDLGKQLPPFPEELKTEDYRVHGCQSMVWLVPSGNAEQLHFQASSDSAIVSGLIALVLRVYSNRVRSSPPSRALSKRSAWPSTCRPRVRMDWRRCWPS
jgi:cysteine desulfuration protein SufE